MGIYLSIYLSIYLYPFMQRKSELTHTAQVQFASIVFAQPFYARNAACHFHNTWAVFVQHCIANKLKCMFSLVEAHKHE